MFIYNFLVCARGFLDEMKDVMRLFGVLGLFEVIWKENDWEFNFKAEFGSILLNCDFWGPSQMTLSIYLLKFS